MPKRKDMKYWNIPVTPHLNEVLEKAIHLNAHVSKSDFVRCAVREKLSKMGLNADSMHACKKMTGEDDGD